ncbi:MAG: hypothetical protein JWO60_2156 [Frankiales bacterium]|nr:hypothetical protein [Frankiales bacterium]
MSVVVLALVLGGAAAPALAAGEPPGDVAFTATVGGRDLDRVDANDPVTLRPADGVVVTVDVRNTGSSAVEVRSVRLDAKVVGLAFLAYTTRVDLRLAPGESGQRAFALDLGDLGGQAVGLLPARLALLSPDREVLASRAVPVDVRGDARSVYGVFALGVAGISLLLLAGLIVRLAAHKLPGNRWSRAWRFAVPGAGLGLTLTFTLSALRLLVPSPGASLSLVVVGGLGGLVAGYLSPAQDDGTGTDDLDEADLAPVVIDLDKPPGPGPRRHAPSPLVPAQGRGDAVTLPPPVRHAP